MAAVLGLAADRRRTISDSALLVAAHLFEAGSQEGATFVRRHFAAVLPFVLLSAQPKRIAEVNRIPTRKPIQIEPAREPDGIFLREDRVGLSSAKGSLVQAADVAPKPVPHNPYDDEGQRDRSEDWEADVRMQDGS